MKNIIYCSLLFCMLLFLQSCGEAIHPDLKLFNLKGRVKTLSYGIVSDNKNYYQGSTLDIYHGEYYDYEFSKDGEWTNPKEKVNRNSDGYITQLGYREMTWDDKGHLTKRMDCSSYEDEPCPGIEYYYKDENIIDSLYEIQPGADAEIIHRYKCGDRDEYGNWTYAQVEIVDISRGGMILDEYSIIRKIKYWPEEELEVKKRSSSSDNATASFYNVIKDRQILFRRDFLYDRYKCLLFFPKTETKGELYIVYFHSDMNTFDGGDVYHFSYIISDDEIFATNGLSTHRNKRNSILQKGLDYGTAEDFVLEIKCNNSSNVELIDVESGDSYGQYNWKFNIDELRKKSYHF